MVIKTSHPFFLFFNADANANAFLHDKTFQLKTDIFGYIPDIWKVNDASLPGKQLGMQEKPHRIKNLVYHVSALLDQFG